MQIQLYAASVVLLRSVLETPGWAKTVGLIYTGGQILCDVLPILKAPNDAEPEEWEEWSHQKGEYEFTDKQFEVCRTAIKHFANEGKISAGPFSLQILAQFKLTED